MTFSFTNYFLRKPGGSIDIKATIGDSGKKRKTYLKQFCLTFFGHEVEIYFKNDNTVDKLLINGENLCAGTIYNVSTSFVPILHCNNSEENAPYYSTDFDTKSKNVLNALESIILNYSHHNTGVERVRNLLADLIFGSKSDILNSIINSSHAPNSLVVALGGSSEEGIVKNQFVNRVIHAILAPVLQFVERSFYYNAKLTYYSSPFRAAPDRYYRFQELEVQEIDPRGANLAMYLDSLPDRRMVSFSEWTNKHFGFEIRLENVGGHASVKIRHSANKDFDNIADIGFGFSQLLPIITQIWDLENSSRRARHFLNSSDYATEYRFVIEQPEIHLHPRMLGDFVDLLVRVSLLEQKRKVKFIVETHSKHLIDRIGAYIAKGILPPSDVNVVLFGSEGESAVNPTSYDINGMLQDWPFDFFLAERL